ncbi:nucleoside kinase [Clostridium botulinum]|uniref:ATPase AAA n=1 Tax=Clostridium botulinum C/D str. DC5 TaxID=1443128 RepID=A0A0A0IBM1_CLOBO|nr:nucleoside kinase [Clostridium botulinum]KEI06649.1 ATPase AAA [Clostridium botulinum C/D str. BKT75002]KEI09561.1 ATPase AAA [Clostridium botulinum C/D str. BKT2873]KGM98859.1 ATPase AAA [Clostridium botulinum C/D str. DC5]KOC55549.1 AAA family ATPase [Clostridium botulinum]KOC56345.1 AAA family ATPase [Clostridium botulinum]
MNKINITLRDNKKISIDKGSNLYEILKKSNLEETRSILGCFNGKIYELSHEVQEDGYFELVDPKRKISVLAYMRTLQFILIKSVRELYPGAKVRIEHSLSKGIFGEIHKDTPLTITDIKNIKEKMKDIIEKNIIIHKVSVSKEKAIEIFKSYDMDAKLRMFKHVDNDKVTLYELDGLYDYFYGPMAYSTGEVQLFDLMYYEPGFILRGPTIDNCNELPEFIDQKKLAKIFYESEQWAQIIDVGDVGALNNHVVSGDIGNLIRVVEAFHEKKVAYIADMIHNRENVKVVLIAGPSSSGKTTFARRLGIQLRVNGLMPVPISLDDYFVNREQTPKDEFGNYDFESIYALDLELFNKNLCELMEGKETRVPEFDFKTGSRSWKEDPFKLPDNGVLIIEGIHGLNEMLTSSISKENKFKIYISALTQLNLDNHNRIATTDVRMIRRIVRDKLSRGYASEDTLKMWPSIRRGEEKNIFVFQEEADVMFNSSLIYELCVLRKYAETELSKIKEDSKVYYEAMRLKSFLNFFKDVDKDLVPDNSILREFIGGSCFYKY